MRTIEVKQLKYDLTPVAGLALVGDHLKAVGQHGAFLEDGDQHVGGKGNPYLSPESVTPSATR